MIQNKKAQSYTNVIILILIVLLISIFGLAFQSFGGSLLTSGNANLDNQSKLYVTNELYGMNLSYENPNDITLPPYLLENETQSNKDYSLEFQYAKEKSEGFWSAVFDIYNAPFIFITLFGISNYVPDWLQGIISTFLWLVVTVGIIYIVRGIVK